MSKNAFVLINHYGDDGVADEGAVLLDVTESRFDELEKRGLVREATDKEVEMSKKSEKTPETKAAPEPANKAAPAAKSK